MGDKWPFVAAVFPFPFAVREGVFTAGVVVAFADVSPEIFRALMGLRLLDLALLSSGLTSSSSSSISSFIGVVEVVCFFLADLVTGPKYPSSDASRVSDGVGEGEITLGVAGIGFDEDRDMVKGGREGIRMTPVT